MNERLTLIDLHCHILPGLDDGAKDIDSCTLMMRACVRSGISALVFTPHFHAERITVDEFCRCRAEAVQRAAGIAQAEHLPLAAQMGAEIYYTPNLPTLELDRLAFDGKRHLLIELPTDYQPPGVTEVLYELLLQGYVPILAHVERYPYVKENPELLYRWVMSGVLAQINASGLLHGGATARWLQQLIRWRMVHLLCSDAHSIHRRPPNLAQGYAKLEFAEQKRFADFAMAVYLNTDKPMEEPTLPVLRFGRWS